MIFLNGKACIEPAIAKLSLSDAGFILWWEKYSPNYFRHQCGVDPGEGYLLLKGSDVPTSTFSVALSFGSVTIPKVAVVRSVELEASSEVASSNGTRLVQVQDIRCYLKQTQVKKNYNSVLYTDVSGSFVFDESTMKDLGGGSYTNWTWETLIQDLWDNSLLESETLNLEDATFPELFPTNYYFESWSHRDALAQVLLDLGFTLEPSTSGTWRIVPLNTDTVIFNLINSQAHLMIQSNNIIDGHAGQIPAKLIFHFLFPEESPSGKENRTYQYEHTVTTAHSYQSILSNSHDSIICPIQAIFDFTNPTEPINKIDLDAFAATVAPRLVKLLYTDDGPDVTFGGFRNTFPSADIGRVTWKDTGSNVSGNGTGAITRVEHFSPVAKPPKLSRSTIPLQKVVGTPQSNVTAEMSTFNLVNLKLISGVKPQEPLEVNNTYGQTYTSLERVESEYCYEDREWNVPQKGTSSDPAPSVALIRFELTEDKTLADSTVSAVSISLANAVLAPITLLDRVDRAHVGFAPRLDPQFGTQVGYRGWAQYVQANTYDIIKMDGPARHITGVTTADVEPDAESFLGTVTNYWGAAPDNRAPAMTESEGATGEDPTNVIRIYDYQNLIVGTIPPDTEYRALYDEVRNVYVLAAIALPSQAEHYALLVADIPKCTWSLTECDHGYASAAAKLFTKQLDAGVHKLKFEGTTYPVINPIWPEIIKAGTTTDADKPVVAIGYLDKWNLGDDTVEEVFVLKNVIYPISIIKGTSTGVVSGTGPITIGTISLLWGRDPRVDSLPTTISVANPEGWEGPSSSIVYAMQVVDGTWLALYVTCPTE